VPHLRVCQALLADAADRAVGFLAEALATGKKIGIIRDFADEGMALVPILKEAISRGIEPESAAELLTIIEAEEQQKKKRIVGKAPQLSPLSSLLSERELEVLKLMAAGFSNLEISTKLIVGLNTTKTHVRHILEKLNARSRAQAISLGKELKLL